MSSAKQMREYELDIYCKENMDVSSWRKGQFAYAI
jgi:hypothetical protein